MNVALPMRRAILVVVASLCMGAWAIAADAEKPLECFTRPSEEAKPTFAGPGLIQQMLVKEGQAVKAGEVLMIQDGDIDAMELRRLELEANSTARIEAADAQLLVKKSTLKRKEGAGPGAYPDAEIEEARADVTLGEKQLVVSEEEQKQAKIKLEAQQKKIEKLSLKAPIDGIVRKIISHVGEWADPQNKDGVIYIVKNDPLDVELNLPIAQAKLLAMGDTVDVQYKGESTWQKATVYFFDPVSESGQEKVRIKAKLPNPENRTAGQRVSVKLPQKLVDAGR